MPDLVVSLRGRTRRSWLIPVAKTILTLFGRRAWPIVLLVLAGVTFEVRIADGPVVMRRSMRHLLTARTPQA